MVSKASAFEVCGMNACSIIKAQNKEPTQCLATDLGPCKFLNLGPCHLSGWCQTSW